MPYKKLDDIHLSKLFSSGLNRTLSCEFCGCMLVDPEHEPIFSSNGEVSCVSLKLFPVIGSPSRSLIISFDCLDSFIW